MKRLTIAGAALLVAAPAFLTAQEPIRAARLKISEPIHIAELDTDLLKGQPFRLGWSPDGSQLYVQTLEGTWADANTGRATATFSHYLFGLGAFVGRNFSSAVREDLQAPPEWFAPYWSAKNGRHAPDVPELSIELKTEQRKLVTTSVPMGGDLAKGGTGGTGASAGDAGAAAYQSQWVPVNTMKYKGEVIGEFVNSVIVPGLTYGWGPPGTGALAYAAQYGGKVVVIDQFGEKRAVPDTKDALLPAWSQDGARLAWLQKDGRKKFQLYVATLSPRP
jgi:hypothetical protein